MFFWFFDLLPWWKDVRQAYLKDNGLSNKISLLKNYGYLVLVEMLKRLKPLARPLFPWSDGSEVIDEKHHIVIAKLTDCPGNITQYVRDTKDALFKLHAQHIVRHCLDATVWLQNEAHMF